MIVSPTFPAEEFDAQEGRDAGRDRERAATTPRPSPTSRSARSCSATSPLAHPAIGWEKSVDAPDARGRRRASTPRHVAARERAARGGRRRRAQGRARRARDGVRRLEGAAAPTPGDAYTAGAAAERPPVLIVQQARGRRRPRSGSPASACRATTPTTTRSASPTRSWARGFTSRLVNEIRVDAGTHLQHRSRFGMFRNAGTFRDQHLHQERDAAEDDRRDAQGGEDAASTRARPRKSWTRPSASSPASSRSGCRRPTRWPRSSSTSSSTGSSPTYLETFSDRIDAVTMADVPPRAEVVLLRRRPAHPRGLEPRAGAQGARGPGPDRGPRAPVGAPCHRRCARSARAAP